MLVTTSLNIGLSVSYKSYNIKFLLTFMQTLMCRLNNAHDISLPTECNFQQFYNKLMPKKFSVRMLGDKNGPLVVCSMLIQQSNVVKRNTE